MIILSITVLGTSYEYPVAGGIIQGGGDTKYAFYIDLIFMWGFTIPLSALSAFVFNFPPLYTFFFLKSDQLIKCIPNAIKCNRYKWVRQLTR
jgi:Na+-driven multidrug efflux pump